MSKLGKTIGERYRIDAELARGGMGVVYRATRLVDDTTVALKMTLGDTVRHRERARFEREMGLAAQMRHPHSLRVLEGGHTSDGLPFLVCELLEGRTLEEAIAQRGRFSVERVLGVGLSVLGALEEAHALGIVHRDIKPANIFLCTTPTPDFVKVLDFGVATQSDGDPQSALTSAAAMVGTPHYMPPEQLGGGTVGPASDLYALGLVLAEMLHGRPILEDETVLSVVMAQASPMPVNLPASVLSTPLGPVLQRAVQKDVAWRFQSAAQMREALLATGVRPPEVSVVMPLQPGFARSHVWIAAVVAFSVGASMVTLAAGAAKTEAPTSSDDEGPRDRSSKKKSAGKSSKGRVAGRLREVTHAKIEAAIEDAGFVPRVTSNMGRNRVWVTYVGDEPLGSVTYFDTDEMSAMIYVDVCDDGPATYVQDGGRIVCIELDEDKGQERSMIEAIVD